MFFRRKEETQLERQQHSTSGCLTRNIRSVLQQLPGQNAQNLVLMQLTCNSPKYHKQNENDQKYTVRLLLSERCSTRHGGKAPCQCGQAKL